MYAHLLNKYTDKLPGWTYSAIKNTLLMVSLLLEAKTVNLWKLKGEVSKVLGNTSTDSRSHYQRLKRWLKLGENSRQVWVTMLQASASLLRNKTRFLILDGTSWKSGGKKYHFLTLSILYQGVSIPIWWQELGKLGISSEWERKGFLRLARKLLSLKGKVLLADREYIGREWFKELLKAGLGFVIRLKKKNYQQQIERKGKPVSKLENKAKAAVGKPVWKRFELDGDSYYFVLIACRSKTGKISFVRLISTLTPAKAAEAYARRYKIEGMFKHLKSNGFDMESMNVKLDYKINMMMAALVLAYTLAVIEGLKQFIKRIAVKKHGSPQMSVFRYGLDLWQNYLREFTSFIKKICSFFKTSSHKGIHRNLVNVP